MSLDVREERLEGGVVVFVTGRIDSNTSDELERLVLAKGGEPRLVVDLSGVEYVSSAGLRVFLMLAKKMKSASGRLGLCALPASVRQVFDLAGFTSLFVVEPTVEQALQRLAS
ncbi:MAG: STAS domain-containing protein [Vicinamibacteria bacterium]